MDSIYKPKYYAHVCSEVSSDYGDYDRYSISWGKQEYYELIRKLGGGRYSEVFEAINTANNKRCAIKLIKPIDEYRLKREVMILQILCNGPNIIKLYDIVKDFHTKIRSLVFEALDGEQLYIIKSKLTDYEIRYFTYGILKALDYCSSKGIMHRDIKGENIIINRENKTVRLIDWGLSEFYYCGDDYGLDVASLNYRPPEILAGDAYYDYGIDIWSMGCVLAELVFDMETFFEGDDVKDQLKKIVKVLGSDGFKNIITKYKIKFPDNQLKSLSKFPKVPLSKFTNSKNKDLVNDEVLDLLEKMLAYDKAERITAKDALKHPYFNILSESDKRNIS